MLSKKLKESASKERLSSTSTYSTRYFDAPIPKYSMPDDGMPEKAAYQLIHDELALDGNPLLNLASFVTTWMEQEANQLISECRNKNFIDHNEYPVMNELETRVVNMLAHLYHAPEECHSVGTSTIGSSEAIMLGLLAHKWAWRKRRQTNNQACDKPNIVFGADVHTCWDKFAKYFDVEPRIIPLEAGRYTVDLKELEQQLDENTICVGAILGTTFTGQMDPIQKINDLLVKLNKENGWEIPIHVDAASGGFIAPFIYPKLIWDFRLPQVKSINVSGHKYGLVYPGIGWVLFRDQADLPEELVFNINYLGGEMPTYTLNFSKNSDMVVGQYYNMIRLGRKGYTAIMKNIYDNCDYLWQLLANSEYFDLLHEKPFLPVITFRLKQKENFTVFDLSERLREHGWIVPAYTLPPNAEEIAILRVVIKENFSRELAERFYQDLLSAYRQLTNQSKQPLQPKQPPSDQRGAC